VVVVNHPSSPSSPKPQPFAAAFFGNQSWKCRAIVANCSVLFDGCLNLAKEQLGTIVYIQAIRPSS
jgi:hypothetical protein